MPAKDRKYTLARPCLCIHQSAVEENWHRMSTVMGDWAPTGMGKRVHVPSSGNAVKCSYALVVTAKRPTVVKLEVYCHSF